MVLNSGFYRMNSLILLLFIFFAVVPLFSQIKGNSGTLQLKTRNSTIWREIQIGAGLTISNINCDSVLVGTEWVSEISQVVVNPCDTIATSIEEQVTPKHSQQLEISTYPNPSNGQTRIVINSLINDLMTVKVYSVLGELVREFEPISVSTTPVEINWDLKNYYGSNLTAGVYLIKAVSKQGTVTQIIQIF